MRKHDETKENNRRRTFTSFCSESFGLFLFPDGSLVWFIFAVLSGGAVLSVIKVTSDKNRATPTVTTASFSNVSRSVSRLLTKERTVHKRNAKANPVTAIPFLFPV